VEVELGVTWEELGTRWSALNGSFSETSGPNPHLRNKDGSHVIFQGFSMTNISGLHCLSLQAGEGCV
jgi:hypothetical protein